MRNVIWILFLLFTSGCSIHQFNNNKLAEQLQHQGPENILAIIEEDTPNDRDLAQHNLNLGYLQLITGQFDAAITSLTQANQEMLALSAASISENVAAGTINETLRSYSGYPTDRVMVHTMLALSYLFNHNIDDARVEMLQADIAMKKLADDDALSGQLASSHLLSAIIYELLDERSNAFISYQLTKDILTQRNTAIPDAVKQGLLRMSYKMGNTSAYQQYRRQYPQLSKGDPNAKQVFSFYFDGVVSHKQSQSITVPSHGGRQLIRIAMPAYAPIRYNKTTLTMDDQLHTKTSVIVENIEKRVREDLKKDYASILLATTTRAIAKDTVVKLANKKAPLLGAVFNVISLISEMADTRSWNMLPANIQLGYLQTKASSVDLFAHNIKTQVDLSQAKQHVLFASSLSDKIFHYQQ